MRLKKTFKFKIQFRQKILSGLKTATLRNSPRALGDYTIFKETKVKIVRVIECSYSITTRGINIHNDQHNITGERGHFGNTHGGSKFYHYSVLGFPDHTEGEKFYKKYLKNKTLFLIDFKLL